MKNEQNKFGLIIADSNEIQKMEEFVFIKEYNDVFCVKEYNYNKKSFFVIHSKIGLVNAAMASQYLIDKFNVKGIWNYGAVGSIGKINQFEIITPKKFYYFDVETPWYEIGQIPGEPKYFLNSLKSNENINIASGHSFVSNLKQINSILQYVKIDVVDMESTAIAQVCYKNKIPFYCVKSVSDVIESTETNKKKINESISKASKLAFNKLLEFINLI